MRLDTIRQIDIDLFMSDLLKGVLKKKGLARKTVNNISSVLASLLRYAHRNKVIDAISLEFFVKSEPNALSALSDKDLAALLKAVMTRATVRPSCWHRMRACGLASGEQFAGPM